MASLSSASKENFFATLAAKRLFPQKGDSK